MQPAVHQQLMLGACSSSRSLLVAHIRPLQQRQSRQSLPAGPVRHVRLRRRVVRAATEEQEFARAAKELKETAALDQFIDKLLNAKSQQELTKLVAENLLACNQKFWIRLATRSDSAASREEKDKLGSLAQTVMVVVDALVKKTEGQLSQSATVLQNILKAAAEDNGEWELPLSDAKLGAMRGAINAAGAAGQLDEALLSNAFAWMRKASDDKLDGMVALLQKVLQLYAAHELSRGGGNSGEAADDIVAQVLAADEGQWEDIIRQAAGKGAVSEPAFMEALQKRMELAVLNLTSGSYAQRVQAEYLKELEGRARAVFKELAGSG